MIKDVQTVQQELEGQYLAESAEIDAAALALYKQSPQLAKDYLTGYSEKTGDETVKRWKKLGEFLLYKYLDGNVKDEFGEVTHPGYPLEWYQRIINDTGDHFKMQKLPGETTTH